MKLLTQADRKVLPDLYEQEEAGVDAVARVKWFTPDSNWTWYVSEFDGDDLCFGLVVGHEIELGYFSLSEISEVRGPLGLAVERDRYFMPATLGLLMRREKEARGER